MFRVNFYQAARLSVSEDSNRLRILPPQLRVCYSDRVWGTEAALLLSLVTDFNDNELADEGAERDAAAGKIIRHALECFHDNHSRVCATWNLNNYVGPFTTFMRKCLMFSSLGGQESTML